MSVAGDVSRAAWMRCPRRMLTVRTDWGIRSILAAAADVIRSAVTVGRTSGCGMRWPTTRGRVSRVSRVASVRELCESAAVKSAERNDISRMLFVSVVLI